MNALHIFFGQFWIPFIVWMIMFTVMTQGRRTSLNGNAVSVGPGSFKELSSFSKEERIRLLHQADQDAFHGWRVIIPVSMYVTNLAGAVALGQTIPKVTDLPNSLWVIIGITLVFVLLGYFVTSRVEIRLIRPFLKIQIEKLRAQGIGQG